MNFLKFSALTVIGSAIWCTVLAWLGGKVGAKLDDKELQALQTGVGVDLTGLIRAVKHESLWVLAIIVLVCVLYFVAMRMTEHRGDSHPGAEK
jgi:membrane protein DedA with SNARE-associated domain